MEGLNTTALAYIGDAVYETYIRSHVLKSGKTHVDVLHNLAVKYVRADGQALAIKKLFDRLSLEEQRLVKRARNHKSMSRPKNADIITYKWATALEALIGYLYLNGDTQRLEEIISMSIQVMDDEEK